VVQDKLDIASELGTQVTINAAEEGPVERVNELTHKTV